MANLERYKGWYNDIANSRLTALANGTEVFRFDLGNEGDFQLTGNTTTKYVLWDNSDNSLNILGGATLDFGASSSEVSYTAGSPLFNLYATNAGTSGSTSAEPFYVKSILTGAGQVGGRARFHCYSNVVSGGWVNALKAYMEFGASGRGTGLNSALCAEMYLPNANITSNGGGYFPLEVEHVSGGTSTVTAGALSGNCTGFIWCQASGDTDGDFDDNGYLMVLKGLTAGAGHLLSANSMTLKTGIGTTTRYLVMSTTENGYGIGASGSPQSYTAGTPPVALYFTSSNTTSTNAEPFYVYSAMTGASGYGGRSRFHSYTNVALQTNFMALKAYAEFGSSGGISGLAAGLCAEIKTPNASLGGGNFYPLELEYVAGGTSTASAAGAGRVGWMYMNNTGDADGDFDDNGVLFDIEGLTAGSGHLYDTDANAGTGDATLKIKVNGTIKYLLIADDAA